MSKKRKQYFSRREGVDFASSSVRWRARIRFVRCTRDSPDDVLQVAEGVFSSKVPQPLHQSKVCMRNSKRERLLS